MEQGRPRRVHFKSPRPSAQVHTESRDADGAGSTAARCVFQSILQTVLYCLLSHTDVITTTGVIGTGTDNKELRSRTTACTLTSRALLLALIFHLDPRIHRAKEVVQVGRPKVSPVARVMEIVPRRLVRIR